MQTEMETVEDIDTFDLIMLANENEPHCEVREDLHIARKVDCTHSVTHLLRYCKGSVLSCEAYAEWSRKTMAESHRECLCGKPLAECWTIIPV